MSSDLQAGLDHVWQACLRLPIDDSAFDSLSPSERREAHDMGVRIQDRLLVSLSRLVDGMTADGVELVGQDGVPLVLRAGDPSASPPDPSASPSDPSASPSDPSASPPDPSASPSDPSASPSDQG